MPKRGDIQCIGHWDQENGSKVGFLMHWTLLIDQKFNLFEFSLNIQLFLSPRSRAFLTIVVCRLRWRCDLPGSISEQYLQLQFELTLNQLMCTCKSKSTLLTITCPNLESQFVSTLKYFIVINNTVLFILFRLQSIFAFFNYFN